MSSGMNMNKVFVETKNIPFKLNLSCGLSSKSIYNPKMENLLDLAAYIIQCKHGGVDLRHHP